MNGPRKPKRKRSSFGIEWYCENPDCFLGMLFENRCDIRIGIAAWCYLCKGGMKPIPKPIQK